MRQNCFVNYNIFLKILDGSRIQFRYFPSLLQHQSTNVPLHACLSATNQHLLIPTFIITFRVVFLSVNRFPAKEYFTYKQVSVTALISNNNALIAKLKMTIVTIPHSGNPGGMEPD